MENNTELVALCTDKAKQWLSPSFDEGTRKSVQAMLDNSDKTELIECFYKDLEFGTGGLRGIMGAGSNRMNIYTVGMATQGFANYLKKNFAGRSMDATSKSSSPMCVKRSLRYITPASRSRLLRAAG